MESPISGHSSSSLTTMSPQVHSPLPIRTPTLSRKAYDSVPFLDLLEDGEDRVQFPQRARSYVLEKLHKLTVDDLDLTEFDRRSSLKLSVEAERRSILDHNVNTEHIEDFRPPSRASNPQIFDQEFVRMDHEVCLFRKINEKSVNPRVFNWI